MMNSNTQKGSSLKMFFWILAVLPLIVTLIVLPNAPDTIPAHYGINNTVNRWGSKYELLILPIITLVFALLGWLCAQRYHSKEHTIDEQNHTMPMDRKALLSGIFCAIAVFNVLTYIFLYSSCNKVTNITSMNIMRILALVLNLFYIVFGNIMPKLKQNHFAGIRVSWTLENEDVWYLTHRFGGKLWVIGGIVLTIVCLIVPNDFAMPISIVGLLIMTVAVCVYAHNQYVHITNEQNKK